MRVPHDHREWPAAWTTVAYKIYPRFAKISLGDALPHGEVSDTLRSRASARSFSRAPVTQGQLGALLKYSCGITRETPAGARRAQPSGGGRYPLEVYPLVFAGSGEVRSGVYHYNVREHALDVLWERAFTPADIGELFTYPWAHEASLAIVITALFNRNQMKYGERGYRQILVEAGAVVQNLYLIATALGIGCCAIDGVKEERIEKILDVDGIAESALVSVVLG